MDQKSFLKKSLHGAYGLGEVNQLEVKASSDARELLMDVRMSLG